MQALGFLFLFFCPLSSCSALAWQRLRQSKMVHARHCTSAAASAWVHFLQPGQGELAGQQYKAHRGPHWGRCASVCSVHDLVLCACFAVRAHRVLTWHSVFVGPSERSYLAEQRRAALRAVHSRTGVGHCSGSKRLLPIAGVVLCSGAGVEAPVTEFEVRGIMNRPCFNPLKPPFYPSLHSNQAQWGFLSFLFDMLNSSKQRVGSHPVSLKNWPRSGLEAAKVVAKVLTLKMAAHGGITTS